MSVKEAHLVYQLLKDKYDDLKNILINKNKYLFPFENLIKIAELYDKVKHNKEINRMISQSSADIFGQLISLLNNENVFGNDLFLNKYYDYDKESHGTDSWDEFSQERKNKNMFNAFIRISELDDVAYNNCIELITHINTVKNDNMKQHQDRDFEYFVISFLVDLGESIENTEQLNQVKTILTKSKINIGAIYEIKKILNKPYWQQFVEMIESKEDHSLRYADLSQISKDIEKEIEKQDELELREAVLNLP